MSTLRLAAVFLGFLAVAPLLLIQPFPDQAAAALTRGEQRSQCPSETRSVGPLTAEVGLSAAFVRGGVIKTCTHGSKTAWSGAPVGPRTKFEAGSLSKPVVAYAAIRLASEGKLDLDAPLTRGGRVFTLRQALGHTAGFDNALSTNPAPVRAGRRFAYAGGGYIVVGQEIERASGMPFRDYMNTVVLPDLGMRDSAFGWKGLSPLDRAAPVADSGLVLALALMASGLAGLLLCAASLAVPSWRHSGKIPAWPLKALASAAVLPGLVAPILMFGRANAAPLAGFVLIFVALAFAGAMLAGRRWRGRIVALTCLVFCAAILAARPGLPLQERNQKFAAPAGLITTATDYAKFLARVGGDLDGPGAVMTSAIVPASPDSDWGLGLGLQRSPEPAVWHWGVNFPGYQALAMRWPDGEVAVVLINGGALTWSPSGLRYSGLVKAQNAIEAFRGRRQGQLWRPIQ